MLPKLRFGFGGEDTTLPRTTKLLVGNNWAIPVDTLFFSVKRGYKRKSHTPESQGTGIFLK